MQDFKVLTFDVVGTLIDFERGMLDYVQRVATMPVDEEQFLVAYRASRASHDSSWYPVTWCACGTKWRRISAFPTARHRRRFSRFGQRVAAVPGFGRSVEAPRAPIQAGRDDQCAGLGADAFRAHPRRAIRRHRQLRRRALPKARPAVFRIRARTAVDARIQPTPHR